MISDDKVLVAMHRAITEATKQKTPFGACLIDNNEEFCVVSANTAHRDGPVAHAELNALLNAGKDTGKLYGWHLITTCEPCVMCLGAAIWCGIDTIYYGLSVKEASAYLPQIEIKPEAILQGAFHKPILSGGWLKPDIHQLFKLYA